MAKSERTTVDVPAEAPVALREPQLAYVAETEPLEGEYNDQLARLRAALAEAERGPWFSEEETFARVEAVIAKYDRP